MALNAPEDPIPETSQSVDPTDPGHRERLRSMVDALVEGGGDASLAARLHETGTPLEARMAGLLAQSRRWLLAATKPVTVAVVFAMWGEQRRLRPRSADNPHGEDCLALKLEQLEEATRDSAIRWRLYSVDDGCPHDSFGIAREIAAEHALGARATVLSLSGALPADEGPLAPLASAEDSRKAGAILLAAMRAIDDGADAVIYTDADNSVHLGQIGLLLRPFVDDGVSVVLGSRKHPDSVLVKEAARWGIGIKVLRHMQRMIGQEVFSRGILDTQAAFKLYDSATLAKIIEDPTVFDFSFDTDWILAALRMGVRIEQVPFSFVDSAAESASITQGPMTTWETLLFGLAKQVKRYGFCEGDAAAMTSVLEEEISDHRDLEQLIDHLPPDLESATEAELGDRDVMTPEALREWIRGRLRAGNRSRS